MKIAIVGTLLGLALAGPAVAQGVSGIGSEEFGLSPRELRSRAEQVEQLIARCMRAEGFPYVAVDFVTIRRGMAADKSLPGMTEEEFTERFGLGVSTLYTGEAPQLSEGYSPGRVGLGEQNVAAYANLSPADQVAYNRTLLGAQGGDTFAVALERENFGRTGGCTREAIEQVFEPSELQASYYNPLDALIRDDPRMIRAVRRYAEAIRAAGFAYDHPDEIEPDLRERLFAITQGGTLRPDDMQPAELEALRDLQDYERRVALEDMRLAEELFDPVETEIERELFAREVK